MPRERTELRLESLTKRREQLRESEEPYETQKILAYELAQDVRRGFQWSYRVQNHCLNKFSRYAEQVAPNDRVGTTETRNFIEVTQRFVGYSALLDEILETYFPHILEASEKERARIAREQERFVERAAKEEERAYHQALDLLIDAELERKRGDLG